MERQVVIQINSQEKQKKKKHQGKKIKRPLNNDKQVQRIRKLKQDTVITDKKVEQAALHHPFLPIALYTYAKWLWKSTNSPVIPLYDDKQLHKAQENITPSNANTS